MVRVTLGIPFYNAATTLLDAIRSAFAQTFQDWELILVDDGSRDGSLKIARSIDDPRVRVFSDGMNRGLPARLNEITELARGEYVARMDADDLMHPERLARQVVFLDEHPEVDVVCTSYYSINMKNRPTGQCNAEAAEISARRLRVGKGVLHPSVLARRSWFRENPYHPTDYLRAEDIELWCRTNLEGRLHLRQLPQLLFFYREEGNVSLRKVLASYHTDRKILWKYGPRACGWPTALREIGKFYLKSATHCMAAACGCQNFLVRRRTQRLTPQQRQDAESILTKILSTPIPSVDKFPDCVMEDE